MNLEEMQKEAEKAFRKAASAFETALAKPIPTELSTKLYLQSIAASLLVITHQQEDLLKELQTTRAAVSSLVARGE